MIDFRYHLVSIVAVLLALAVGIVVGSGLLGDPLATLIRSELRDVRARNDQLLDQNIEQERELDEAAAFEDVAGRWIMDARLQGREVVIFEMEGTEGGVVSQVETAIARAGGDTATKLIVGARFGLRARADRDALAGILGMDPVPAAELRREAARVLGQRAGQAASRPEFGLSAGPSEQRFIDLVTALEEARFVSTDEPGQDGFVPTFSAFLVVGGSNGPPHFQTATFARDLSLGIARSGAQVLAGETTTSRWGIVEEVRGDPQAQVAVSTVDQIETVPGQAAIVLVFAELGTGKAGHYGVRDGASRVIPEPPEG